MRHISRWPWRYAYAAAYCYPTHEREKRGKRKSRDDGHSRHESRWHGRGAGFGVRRPLRYLAYRLDLDEGQMRRMAAVLNQLKTEREQVALDEKRTVSALAELLGEGTPSLEDARAALKPRIDSAEHMVAETAKAVVAVSEFLDEDQRDEFIQLLLTGSITL